MSTSREIGVLAVAAAISLAALAVVLMAHAGENSTTPREDASTATGTSVAKPKPGAPRFDYVLDLDTGAMTPLPKAIIQSAAELGQYATSPDGSRLAYVGDDDDGTLRSSSQASTAAGSAR